MSENNVNDKYMKVIESIGELLMEKDKTIKFNEYEIKSLKKKLERIEQYMDYYVQPTENPTNEDYKNTSNTILKQVSN